MERKYFVPALWQQAVEMQLFPPGAHLGHLSEDWTPTDQTERTKPGKQELCKAQILYKDSVTHAASG